MWNLLPLRLAVVIGLAAWLTVKVMTSYPLPDWRQGELIMIVPGAEMETDSTFERDLATLFARQIGVKLRLLYQNAEQAATSLDQGRAHLAAGLRAEARRSLRYSTSYQTLDERVVCSRDAPHDFDELAAREIIVAPGSPQEAALHEVHAQHEEVTWEARNDASPFELLQEVGEGALDCTVANVEQLATMRNLYPDLSVGISLGAPSAMSWAISADGDERLLEEVNRFLDRIRRDGTLAQLIERHYGHNERLTEADAATFIADTQSRLPHYRLWFEEAAALTGLDWKLLAALAYRESRWNPAATSYTHVRGMMMLTDDTADRMGVKNRLDPKESILAGARYLQLLKEQLPLRIAEEDRLWMALAAYNQGMGHLEDARILAARQGLNPDVWADVKRMLPLLSRPEYFENAKYGQARGGEAVIHVETVRLYHDMLKRLDSQHALGYAPPSTAARPHGDDRKQARSASPVTSG